ncbi:putative integral membrane protein conserved region-domain-containing protein [Pilobolus umbonatus]|nr:putative integral membrane protein conserved region-domain-containing protein [Pilobolus umbonatus]
MSYSFLLGYLLGGITLIPVMVCTLLFFFYIRTHIILPTYLLMTATDTPVKKSVVKETELVDEVSANHLYRVGWLRVTRTDQEENESIGEMVKSYITTGKTKKEAVNVFFAVLKYNTLYLYDSERQLDCKEVINLTQHTVSIHPPGLVDAELYSRPNLIKLERSNGVYYINCHKCIDKEDWYFALIRASKSKSMADPMMDNTHFDQSAMNKLIKVLHSDEHNFQTQWFNAILGRIFCGVYRTEDIKDTLYKKVITKLDKINAKRPPFLGEITVRSVDPGQSLPRFTQPKLLGLSPTGEMSVEANMHYDGGFRIEIETVLKWKYMDRLKPLTIDLVLGITLKEIQGKFLMKIKEPPTNRFWYAFHELPKMEWKVEPVVWEKRVGYSVVVKAIETKIQEILMETMILPHFDDITFFPTDGLGGIFEKKLPAKNRPQKDEVLLNTAKSLPELFSSVPDRQPSKLRTELLLPAHEPFEYIHQDQISPMLLPDNPMDTIKGQYTQSILSTSPGSLSSSPTEDIVDITVTPSNSTSLSSDPPDTPIQEESRLRKSSSLALLRPKTGASTAINILPAMAHKTLVDKKEDVAIISL